MSQILPVTQTLIRATLSLGLGIASTGLLAAATWAATPTETAIPLPQQLVQQGREFYTSGQFAQAAALWEQAAQAYQAQGDNLSQAQALSNLSLAYQQLGQWPLARKAITSSLQLLQAQPPRTAAHFQLLAQALNTQGQLQLASGQPEAALTTWQQAATAYAQAGDRVGVSRSQINQAQALQRLGLYRQALTLLTQTQQTLQKQPRSPTQVAQWLSLGNTLRAVGNLNQSRQVLQQALQVARELGSPADLSAALLSIGNLERAAGEPQAALDFYQQAAIAGGSSLTTVEAQLNQLSVLIETHQWQPAQALWPTLQHVLGTLPVQQATIAARINLAESLIRLRQLQPEAAPAATLIAQDLATALQQAQSLGDRRSHAYALGTLGRLYELDGQWQSAADLTRQALLQAQALNAPDIAYRWQWQLGRMLKAQGDRQGAIATYTEAVNSLQALRRDLVAINPDVQFSFRDSVEPVYRELVDLLLPPEPQAVSQTNLVQARNVIESLQVAELENFLREACLDAQPKQIDQIDRSAAVLYPIILPDRIAVILSLPQQPLRYISTPVPQAQAEATLGRLRRQVQLRNESFLPLAQEVYDWLIRPLEPELLQHQVKTLVFIPDGPLRNIPLATLHDRQQYLLQKYNIALTPGLQLLETQSLRQTDLKALTAGLTEARQGFSALPNVKQELQEIQAEVTARQLLNQEFTQATLKQEIQSLPFPIVHLATHGQFSSNADETFLLTWDNRVNINQLNTILRARSETEQVPIELLVLSACQTATGDNRAALGLAGMAVRAGARSTLATLWFVSDEATAILMRRFYENLAQGHVTKAEALRRAQLSLLENPQYRFPFFWGAYVLVGNWQ